jgi:hypothetical protein
MPVRLPPGRLRLAARPCSTKLETATTIGVVLVDFFAAHAASELAVTSTSTGRRSSSATRSGYERDASAGYRRSMTRFRPSAQPRSRKPFTKAFQFSSAAPVTGRNTPRYPTRYIFPALYSARPESWARREESPAHKTSRKKEKRRRKRGGQV